MSSYDYRTTIVRLSYDIVRFTYDLASHQAIIVKSYVIVRLSYGYRSTVVRCRSVTTNLRLQYRSRFWDFLRNLRCHPSHDVAARSDQGLNVRVRCEEVHQSEKSRIH